MEFNDIYDKEISKNILNMKYRDCHANEGKIEKGT